MAQVEIPDVCRFDVQPDSIELRTRTNGDEIRIKGINLDQDNGAALAWLINHPDLLSVRIKVKEV